MSYAAKPVSAAEQGNNPLALVSLILGIIGLVSGGCPFSLAAAITGWMGMKREPSGQAKIGFWLGVAGMAFQIVIGLVVLLAFGTALGIGYTTVERQPAPPMLAPPVMVQEFETIPTLEEAVPGFDATPIEPNVEQAEPEDDVNSAEPPIEEVPETAP